ncbi:hypothetical protein C2869_15170 [Saccharobesus litoralis]|uniref:Protein SirB1 N-terminal domain-containing protein n=1 Tax=Saccharobesus litoralis TaxID=2172099 RepID=A0A2S0VTZ9_9ALTE|nr:tetratricopeptide repeat protein [Saccharobesus litoralis]AWB67696.1 hypothetical protein C2869_15170 [Saccharobesus litoralis]
MSVLLSHPIIYPEIATSPSSVKSLFLAYLEKLKPILKTEKVETSTQVFVDVVAELRQKIPDTADELDKIRQLLDFFFIDALFSQPSKNEPSLKAKHFDLCDVLAFRTGQQSALSILFCDFARAINLQSEIIVTPGPYLVRIELADASYVFLEPANGISLDWQDVEATFANNPLISVLEQEFGLDAIHEDALELEQEQIDVEFNDPTQTATEVGSPDETIINKALVGDKEIVLKAISLFKAMLIAEGRFAHALSICEVLLEQEPDNPYLRRDRGYLLEQLDCRNQAIADYEYFVEQCPEDPIAKMLKAQIEEHLPSVHSVH